jgi:hypothetical protein
MQARAIDEADYTLEVLPGGKIARFHWRGPITANDRRDNVRRMVEFCKARRIQCLLIDGRDQLPVGPIVDNFDFGSSVPIEMRGLRIAVVHRPDDEALPFIETVAFNRGGNTQSFVDTDTALEWLEPFTRPA